MDDTELEALLVQVRSLGDQAMRLLPVLAEELKKTRAAAYEAVEAFNQTWGRLSSNEQQTIRHFGSLPSAMDALKDVLDLRTR